MDSEVTYETIGVAIASLHSIFHSLVGEHEGYYQAVLPHVLISEIVQHYGQLDHLTQEDLAQFVRLVVVIMRSADPRVDDLLNASLFPLLEEYPRLRMGFLAASPAEAIARHATWVSA